jgi:hypothetical protein
MRDPRHDPRPTDLCCQCAIPRERAGHPLADHTIPGPYSVGCTRCNCAEFMAYRPECLSCGKPLPPNDPRGVCSPECERSSDGLMTWRVLRLFKPR